MSEGADLAALADQWRNDLASWAIPESILDRASQSPWIHPVAMFTAPGEIPDSPSHARAREAVPTGGSVLDVGCGGGRAAMALVPPAGLVIGVDHQPDMLDAFADAAQLRGVQHREVLGEWSQVERDVPACDVAVSHHVAYNVPDIVPFLRALGRHARHRVVIEVPLTHPLSSMNPLWKRFWDLDRPTSPTAHQLHGILEALGFEPSIEVWPDQTWGQRVALSEEERVEHMRVRLCLTQDRDAEVAAALMEDLDSGPREVATLWWDPRRGGANRALRDGEVPASA